MTINMYHGDHAPPHLHVRMASFRAKFALPSLALIEGRLPPTALGMVEDWGELHRDELMANWDRVESGEALQRIAPME